MKKIINLLLITLSLILGFLYAAKTQEFKNYQAQVEKTINTVFEIDQYATDKNEGLTAPMIEELRTLIEN